MEDRLSALPEPILLHILSFIPTLDVVRTSLLSTRWRTLWTSVDVLGLDEDNDFFSFSTGKMNGERKRKNNRSFAKFVRTALLSFHHTPTLHKLRLRCCSQYFLLKDWVIRTAVSRRVQTLDLRLPRHGDILYGKAGRLPSLLLTSQSLVDLRLDLEGSTLILPGAPALVGLRRMHLRRLKFCDDNSTRVLFSSSTALSSLVLENCDYRKLHCLEISCSSLQELAIEYCTTLDYPADGLNSRLDSCQVKIAAPQLSSFVYRASVAQSYVVEPLSCVEYVKIQFQPFEVQKGLDKLSVLDRASSFFSSLSSARNLDICPVCVEALQFRAIPFHNLNVLTTGVYEHDQYSGLRAVLRLLVSNPRLRALIVDVRSSYMLPLSVGKEDLLNYLGTCFKHGCGAVERVEIKCTVYPSSRGITSCTTETVLELVKALLGSQANLKNLILSNRLFYDSYNSLSCSRRHAVMEKVLSFPRCTRGLAVAFI